MYSVVYLFPIFLTAYYSFPFILYKLITIKPNIEYFKNILQKIINKNEYISKDIRISYAELTMFDIEKDYYEYNQETIIEITHQSSAKK